MLKPFEKEPRMPDDTWPEGWMLEVNCHDPQMILLSLTPPPLFKNESKRKQLPIGSLGLPE